MPFFLPPLRIPPISHLRVLCVAGLKIPVAVCEAAPQGVGRRRSARGRAQARAHADESEEARVRTVVRRRPARALALALATLNALAATCGP
jgi:hypothetical protein